MYGLCVNISFIALGQTLRSGIAESYKKCMLNFIKKTAKLLSEEIVPFFIPIQLSQILPAVDTARIF